MNKKQIGKGWGFPTQLPTAHYFNNSTLSLCGRYNFDGKLDDTKHAHINNCIICMKKRKELESEKQK